MQYPGLRYDPVRGKTVFFTLLLAVFMPGLHADAQVFRSERFDFQVGILVDGLRYPWGMVFLPDGAILVTERPGTLRVIRNGALLPQAITGLPAIE